MTFDPITAILGIGGKIIDKIFPDQESKQRATVELAKMAQDGELKFLETQMSAIVMEAKSADPWTSRARPSFLYLMYLLILMAIPMGVLSCFRPDMATQIAEGMGAWLESLPDSLYTLFGVGYLGYTGARTWDKTKVLSGKK